MLWKWQNRQRYNQSCPGDAVIGVSGLLQRRPSYRPGGRQSSARNSHSVNPITLVTAAQNCGSNTAVQITFHFNVVWLTDIVAVKIERIEVWSDLSPISLKH